MTNTITQCVGREILDSRGNPTVEVELFLSQGQSVIASVPSGASTGMNEAVELRDKDPARFAGKGVLKAIQNINAIIAPTLIGQDPTEQKKLDQQLLDLDGTPTKEKLGANALLAVSLAIAKAGAIASHLELHDYLAADNFQTLPAPMMNIINGGAHSNNGLNFQEFMILPLGFNRFSDALRAGVEIFHVLKNILEEKNLSTNVGDEGGFGPHLPSHQAALDLIMRAIEKAGYRSGEQIFLGLDTASSEFYRDKKYLLTNENLTLDAAGMVEYLAKLVAEYPIISIEDGMAENDWGGWELLTQKLGQHVQLVGDDLFVTNTMLLQRGIQAHVANAILIKPNQIGTLTQTIDAIQLAQNASYGTIVSHRSGETEDTTIADIAVGLNAHQIKTGSLSRSERVAKYNELLRIESHRPDLLYAGPMMKNLLQRV